MTMDIAQLSIDELARRRDELRTRYDAYRARGLKLDMTRGKPGADQLELTKDMMTVLGPSDTKASDGSDIRNYGGLDGLPEMKALFGDLLGAPAEQVIIGGNSSLQLMHDTVVRALLHGVVDGQGPWLGQRAKFLC